MSSEPALLCLCLVTQQLARRIMNEVRLAARRASDGRVVVFCILWRVRQPVLHVHPGLGTSE